MNPISKTLTRREFLVVAGCGCAGLVIAGCGCARVSEATTAAAAACPYGYRLDASPCLLYTSDPAHGRPRGELGGPPTIKKKKTK